MGFRRYEHLLPRTSTPKSTAPRPEDNAMYYYQLYGLNLASRVEHPTLAPAADEAQIIVEYGTVPKSLHPSLDSGVLFRVNR